MSDKKKLLLIASRVPYPITSGDKIKSYNFLKILSNNYQISLVIITDEGPTVEAIRELEKFTVKLKIFVKPKIKFYLNTLKFIVNRLPLQVNYYYFKDVQKYIDRLLIDIDIAISALVRTSQYLNNYKGEKYLDMVDSIGLNYKRSRKQVKLFFWKAIYTIEANRLINYEKNCVSEFNNTFFVNKFESEYWSKFGKTTWIPNGVHNELFNYTKKDNKYENYISFLGKMDYPPNVDAVLWFVKHVMGKLSGQINFIIVGSKPNKKILSLIKNNQNIRVTGFVEDPYEILNSSFAVIAPMQSGGGIQNKILEAMALGSINITTSLGAKPIISAKNQEHLIVEDDPEKMASIINDIFNNKEKYSKMGASSKRFIKNNYTWENYESKLMSVIKG